tara:strand:+ start:1332 stop:1973 length:642 start_codon:yes stop_codon:yes gene_type:complete
MARTKAKSAAASTGKDTRGERTRRKIKKTIAALARKKDVPDFTLADICKAADITTGAFYFHFKSKEEAIEEMVVDEFHHLYQGLLEAPDSNGLRPFLNDLVTRITAYHHKQKRLPRALQMTINAAPAIHDSWINERAPLIDKMEALIAEARAEKNLGTESSRYLAYYLLNAVEDLGMDAFQWNNPTLSRFAEDSTEWNRKQIELWSWAVLAPI